MKYLKTFEGLFDAPEPPVELINSLKIISDVQGVGGEYYSVLLKWFEDIWVSHYHNEEEGYDKLEQFYRNPRLSDLDKKQAYVAKLAIHFEFIKHWIDLKKYSIAELKGYTFEQFKKKAWTEIKDEYNDLGKISWDPKKNLNYFSEPSFTKTDNNDWTWFSYGGESTLTFVANIIHSFYPVYDDFTEEENFHVLYNTKTLELYTIINVNKRGLGILYIQHNSNLLKVPDGVDKQLNKFIDDNMDGELFDDIEFAAMGRGSQERYNVNWATFYPIFTKYSSDKDNTTAIHLAFKAGAVSSRKYNKLLKETFNNIIISKNKIHTFLNDYDDFAEFFDDDSKDFVEQYYEDSGFDNTYSWTDFQWENYFDITSDRVKDLMINDINTKLDDNIEQFNYQELETWIDNNFRREIQMAAANAQHVADEDAVGKYLKQQLENNFTFKWSNKHNGFMLDVTEWVDKLMSDPENYDPDQYSDITEFIQEYLTENDKLLTVIVPNYGWDGDVTEEIWDEELLSRWHEYV